MDNINTMIDETLAKVEETEVLYFNEKISSYIELKATTDGFKGEIQELKEKGNVEELEGKLEEIKAWCDEKSNELGTEEEVQNELNNTEEEKQQDKIIIQEDDFNSMLNVLDENHIETELPTAELPNIDLGIEEETTEEVKNDENEDSVAIDSFLNNQTNGQPNIFAL